MHIRFAIYDDFATRFTHSEAWWYSEHWKKWVQINPADAFTSAKLLTEEEYHHIFPNLPPLPRNAFVPRLRRVA
jgi:hypothetical protein